MTFIISTLVVLIVNEYILHNKIIIKEKRMYLLFITLAGLFGLAFASSTQGVSYENTIFFPAVISYFIIKYIGNIKKAIIQETVFIFTIVLGGLLLGVKGGHVGYAVFLLILCNIYTLGLLIKSLSYILIMVPLLKPVLNEWIPVELLVSSVLFLVSIMIIERLKKHFNSYLLTICFMLFPFGFLNTAGLEIEYTRMVDLMLAPIFIFLSLFSFSKADKNENFLTVIISFCLYFYNLYMKDVNFYPLLITMVLFLSNSEILLKYFKGKDKALFSHFSFCTFLNLTFATSYLWDIIDYNNITSSYLNFFLVTVYLAIFFSTIIKSLFLGKELFHGSLTANEDIRLAIEKAGMVISSCFLFFGILNYKNLQSIHSNGALKATFFLVVISIAAFLLLIKYYNLRYLFQKLKYKLISIGSIEIRNCIRNDKNVKSRNLPMIEYPWDYNWGIEQNRLRLVVTVVILILIYFLLGVSVG